MRNIILIEPSVVWRIILFSPLLFLINFPFEFNADYVNYFPNYVYGQFAYEPLFEWYSFFVREILSLDFFRFWISLTVIEVLLFSLIYRNWLTIVLSFFSIVGMSQFFYGTQIRYAIAALFLIYIFVYVSRLYLKIFMAITISLFHFGGFILSVVGFIGNYIKPSLLVINKFRTLVFFAVSLVLVYIFLQNFDLIVSVTRFSYYIDSGKYTEPISLALFSYLFLSLAFLIFGYSSNSNMRSVELKLGIILLTFSLSFSPIAGLSGRMSLFYFVLEPLIISKIITIKGSLYIKILLFSLFITRCLFYIFSATLYFY